MYYVGSNYLRNTLSPEKNTYMSLVHNKMNFQQVKFFLNSVSCPLCRSFSSIIL